MSGSAIQELLQRLTYSNTNTNNTNTNTNNTTNNVEYYHNELQNIRNEGDTNHLFLRTILECTTILQSTSSIQSSSLQFNPQQIGAIFTLLSSITFCFSATSISSKLIQLIGVVKTCSLGLGLVGIGLSLLSMSSSSSYYYYRRYHCYDE